MSREKGCTCNHDVKSSTGVVNTVCENAGCWCESQGEMYDHDVNSVAKVVNIVCEYVGCWCESQGYNHDVNSSTRVLKMLVVGASYKERCTTMM